jgi:hypothetical protein
MNQDNFVIDQIKTIIEKELLADTSQLKETDNLELTLGIDQETDLPRLVSVISQNFEISSETKELLCQATTLKQLASIVIEETELG